MASDKDAQTLLLENLICGRQSGLGTMEELVQRALEQVSADGGLPPVQPTAIRDAYTLLLQRNKELQDRVTELQADAWNLGHVDGQDYARRGTIRHNPYRKAD